MWYEILPPYLIIFAAMAFPHYFAYYSCKLVTDHYYRRDLHEMEGRMGYLRDRRLDEYTNPYNVHGLENIPDGEFEDEKGATGDVERDQCPADFGKDDDEPEQPTVEAGNEEQSKKEDTAEGECR